MATSAGGLFRFLLAADSGIRARCDQAVALSQLPSISPSAISNPVA